MSIRPALYFHEKTLWFSAGEAVLVLPVGGWVQPSSSGGHADSPEPKRRLKSLLDVSGLSQHFDIKAGPAASPEDLELIHPPDYIARLKAMSDAGGGAIHPTAPFGAGAYEIAALSAGQAISAVNAVASGARRLAYAITRPSGHHCGKSTPMGFCLLANVAIAVEVARRNGVGRIAILDWDVHHGNGTEECFYDDGGVLTISLHQDGCFPPGASGAADARGTGAGVGTNVNIPLWPGGGDVIYRYAFDHIVAPALEAFAPEIIIVVNGLDANGVDPLARMMAHSETFRALTRKTLGLASTLCGGRAVFVQEGGYSEAAVPFCAHAVLEEIAGVRTAVEDPFLELLQLQQPGDAFNRAQIDALSRHPFAR